MWYEPRQFPFMERIAQRWLDIKRELHVLDTSRFFPWGQTHMYSQPSGWQICPLFVDLYFDIKSRCDENRKRCPITAELVASIPGMTSAAFSALLPGTHVLPHPGHERRCLRSHLGLVVPDRCELKVGEETRSWHDGEWLVFDDTTFHEAWNRSDTVRVVLMIDFLRAAHGIEDPPLPPGFDPSPPQFPPGYA